jgi:hypothetical protein
MDQLYNFLGWEELPGIRDELFEPPPKGWSTVKYQIPILNKQNRFSVSNFGHCYLFDICDLGFGISITPVLQNSSLSLPTKPFNSLHPANTCVDYPTALSANSQTEYLLTARNRG